MHVASVGGSANHGGVADQISFVVAELRWKRYGTLVASGRVPHDCLEPRPVEEEGEAVAAAFQGPAFVAWRREGEGDPVGAATQALADSSGTDEGGRLPREAD